MDSFQLIDLFPCWWLVLGWLKSDVCTLIIRLVFKKDNNLFSACLDRVLVSHIFDLSAFAEAVKLLVEDENDNLRILVVDNISYYFRSYAQTEIDEKMPALRYIGMLLRQLARKHNMTVITNNHVTTSYRQKGRPDSGLDCVPYLGDTWAFMLDFRIKLCIRSGEDVNRTARVTKSTYAMANESLEAVEFTINVPFIMHSCRCHRFTIF